MNTYERQRLTICVLFALFVITNLIEIKIIGERDGTIKCLESKLVYYDRLLKVDQMQDSIIKSMPEYVMQGCHLDSNGVYQLNLK